MNPKYDRLPEKMRPAAKRYVEQGTIPGDFLQAVLRDSLVDAFGRADTENEPLLGDYATWLYNDIPQRCWGSQKAIEQWSESGGLEGRKEVEA